MAQLTAVAQAVIGALLANRDDTVLDDMHALYGFSAIIAIAILYSYRGSPFMKGNEHVLYGLRQPVHHGARAPQPVPGVTFAPGGPRRGDRH